MHRINGVFAARLLAVCICVPLILLSLGCTGFVEFDDPVPRITSRPTAEPTETPLPTEEPSEEPTEAPTAEPAAAATDSATEVPEASSAEPTEQAEATPSAPQTAAASLGFAGDLLFMQAQITAARTGSGYDFKDMFRPMQGLFESVDFMLLNFEGTLAGAEAGYTEPKPTAIPPTEEEPNPPKLYQRFNAPDEVVSDLKALGVDGFSTANNHCLDKGVDGLLRTIQVMDAAGVFHTGTFASAQSFNTADIVNINGIKVGFVSTTHYVNSYDSLLSSEQAGYMVTRLFNDAMNKGAIRRCREQGAELVVVLAHWGSQYQDSYNSEQTTYAQKLISFGADVIIGCHPHVVQGIEWVTGSRAGVPVTVPVVYSMGNFISNMSRGNYPVDIGLFVRIDIERAPGGEAAVTGVSYVPTYDYQHVVNGRYINEVIPCFFDMSGVPSLEGLSGARSGIERARQHCAAIIGGGVPQINNPSV